MRGPELHERYAQVKEGLPDHVRLIAVSKKRSVEEIKALYDLGHRDFGENYPQELREKQPLLPADIKWHFIGHLQSNKVKYIAPFVHLIHSVDSAGLLDEIQKRALAEGRKIAVLFQVHIAQEESKHGLSTGTAKELAKKWAEGTWPNVELRGMMGMATLTDDGNVIAAEFQGLLNTFNAIRDIPGLDPSTFSELSMGMSSDVELAITAGSTMVRIGTALFGEREG